MFEWKGWRTDHLRSRGLSKCNKWIHVDCYFGINHKRMCDVEILVVILVYVLSHEDHRVIEDGQEEGIRMQLKKDPMFLGGSKVGWHTFCVTI